MSKYTSFIRSVRIRYLSGLLIIAAASGATMITLNRMNAYQHEVDALGGSIVDRPRGRTTPAGLAGGQADKHPQQDRRSHGSR